MFASFTKSNKSNANARYTELINSLQTDLQQLQTELKVSYDLHAEKDAQIKRSNNTIAIHNKIISEQSCQIEKLQQQLNNKRSHENFKNFVVFIIALIIISIVLCHYT